VSGLRRSGHSFTETRTVDAAINPAARLNASLPPPVRWITILMRIANGVLNNEEPRYGEDLTMPSGTTPSNLVFTLAPFGDPFDQYYEEIIKPAVESAKMRALRADEIYGTRHIINDIWQSILTAEVVIAEMTGRNANVLYEVGLSHAVDKPVIMITQTMDDIPFDLRAIRCIVYSTNRPRWDANLRRSISNTIKSVMNDKNRVPILAISERYSSKAEEEEARDAAAAAQRAVAAFMLRSMSPAALHHLRSLRDRTNPRTAHIFIPEDNNTGLCGELNHLKTLGYIQFTGHSNIHGVENLPRDNQSYGILYDAIEVTETGREFLELHDKLV